MYDELVERLHKRIALTTAGSPLQDDLRDAADAIEEMSKDLKRSKEWESFWETEANEALKKFQTAVAKMPRWIPVTERLPENGYYVLVCEDGDIMMAWYSGGEWCLRDIYEIIELKPTHWMPLPQPPKEEEE